MAFPMGELDAAMADTARTGSLAGDSPILGRSPRQLAWRRLRRDKAAMAGAVVVAIVVGVAIFATPLVRLYGHSVTGFNSDLTSADTGLPFGRFGGASGSHWLGVEPVNGRDILARLIAGARTSLLIAGAASALSLVLGVSVGALAGYYRGVVDAVLGRIMDVLLSFPTLLFAIALLAIFNQSPSFLGMSGQTLNFAVLIFVLGFFTFSYLARIVRGQVLVIAEKDFIDAARGIGASDWRIITREILPNLAGPVLVWTTLMIPSYVLGEASLSFLGVGVQSPTASWGEMLSHAKDYVGKDPMYLIWPAIALFVTVLAFNLLGDGLRDALDPKSSR